MSHKVKNFDKLNIRVGEALEFTVETAGSKNISSSWVLKFKAGEEKSINVKIEAQTSFTVEGDNYPATQFHSQDGVKLFRPFHASIDFAEGDKLSFSPIAVSDYDLISNLTSIVDQEYNTIKELTDFEKELRFALLRQVELL